MGTQILLLLQLTFILKHFLSPEKILSSVRGPYRVVRVVSSSNCNRIASSVLCESCLRHREEDIIKTILTEIRRGQFWLDSFSSG